MQEVCDFLKKCGTYYLATCDDGQPRVRPFGTAEIFEGKLYIQTGKVKDVSKQIAKNAKVEICAYDNAGNWLRIAAAAVEDDRREVQEHMLEAYPELKGMYAVGDGNMEALYLKGAVATFSSFANPKIKTVEF